MINKINLNPINNDPFDIYRQRQMNQKIAVVADNKPDKFESSKESEKREKIIKYSSIAIGSILVLIALIKRKNISKFIQNLFNKEEKNILSELPKPETPNTPTPEIPKEEPPISISPEKPKEEIPAELPNDSLIDEPKENGQIIFPEYTAEEMPKTEEMSPIVPKPSLNKSESLENTISNTKKVSDKEIRSLISGYLDLDYKYKLSDTEKALIEKKYDSGFAIKYIETLSRPVDENSIKFMTKLVNICDGKYVEFWKNNPDKLILINNAGSLQDKIDKNMKESELELIIDSFKILFGDNVENKALEDIISYKQTLFDRINGTIIHQNKINQVLNFLDKKENLDTEEIKKVRLTMNYLQNILEDQLYVSDLNNETIYNNFNNILTSLNKTKFDKEEIIQLQNSLIAFKEAIFDLNKKKEAHNKINSITELIEKHGKKMKGINLNRVERHLKGSLFSTIEFEGQPLSEVMSKAKNDENLRSRVCNYLNNNQPNLEKDAFTSTSLSVVKAFNEKGDVHWILTPGKNVKGLYIEDAYDILSKRKEGREAEVLIQCGTTIQIKKAEFQNGVWELVGTIN